MHQPVLVIRLPRELHATRRTSSSAWARRANAAERPDPQTSPTFPFTEAPYLARLMILRLTERSIVVGWKSPGIADHRAHRRPHPTAAGPPNVRGRLPIASCLPAPRETIEDP
jgi:hypothetical protein